MGSLHEMRNTMEDKFNEINDSFKRQRSPPKLTSEQ